MSSDTDDVYVLTDDQVDMLRHAIGQTYMFDGFDQLCIYVGDDEANKVAELLVTLGFNDPRSEEDE